MENSELKLKVANHLSEIIKEKKITQVQVAKILEIDQPKISALMKGNFKNFSLERVIIFLNKLGVDVTIKVSPSVADKGCVIVSRIL